MGDTSAFLARWAALARRHADADPSARAALVEDVLGRGLGAVVGEVPVQPGEVTDAERLTLERDLVAASGEFDAFGYFWHHPDLAWALCGHDEELRHFVSTGWRDLRLPSPDFDLWWYWQTYLEPTREEVNPFVHYLAEGRHLGNARVPAVHPWRDPGLRPTAPRRVCLFAGYDPDGMVDDTVVAYLQELSRFADVYYLADNEVEAGELAKLESCTRGRWAVRHGRYDFGSYSMLARDLVGWDVLETYDELILANDSCYLVQPFDRVFAAMDQAPGDWWGLQATYDVFTRADQERLGRPLRVEEVTDGVRALDGQMYATDAEGPGHTNLSDDRFHVGSYFVAFRSAVIKDPGFRLRLDSVVSQARKTNIVRKYEIGLSRYLLLAGYRLATYVPDVLPFHPVYRETAFTLLAEGFPLLKRQLMADNPMDTPDLRQWSHRLLDVVPDADVAPIRDNLLRVSSPWSLHRSFSSRSRPDGTVVTLEAVQPEDFDEEDRWVPKHPHWWAFPVDPVTGRLEGSARAVYEVVRHDPSIRKIVLTGATQQKLGGANVTTHPMASVAAQFYLLRAGQVFVSRGARRDVGHPISGELHQFVLLGRGTPVLAFGAGVPVGDGLDEHLRHNERTHDLDITRAVVSTSPAQADLLRPSLASPFRPSTWVLGSPRTDFLLADEEALPADLRHQVEDLRALLDGRRLVLWSPHDGDDAEPTEVWDRLAVQVAARGAVLGLRTTPGGAGDALDVSVARFPDVEAVLRLTAVLVSDYAPDLVDFLVTDRPVVCFAPDIDEVRAHPGFVVDPDIELPGGAVRSRAALVDAVTSALDGSWAGSTAYGAARDRLHAFHDGSSAARVVRRVRETYLPVQEWLAADA